MSRVLLAFSKYDCTIGYVQGMNHIVDALMHHCSEDVSFWLFVSLIEDYEMRDIYQEGISGLFKHIHCLHALLEKHLPKLLEHLHKSYIDIEMFASNWIFTLYFNSLPLPEVSAPFLTSFFEYGWAFFYRFTICYLRALESRILEVDEAENCEILEVIKTPQKMAQSSEDLSSDSLVTNAQISSSSDP